jgi:hypothetical protein
MRSVILEYQIRIAFAAVHNGWIRWRDTAEKSVFDDSGLEVRVIDEIWLGFPHPTVHFSGSPFPFVEFSSQKTTVKPLNFFTVRRMTGIRIFLPFLQYELR